MAGSVENSLLKERTEEGKMVMVFVWQSLSHDFAKQVLWVICLQHNKLKILWLQA